MKRKKWSEVEEQTLLSKYSELLNSGSLGKLKTREKKFRPIAEHVNSAHHLVDPVSFPFRWSWRDVSIKVQNMRHQYLGVKQKIRLSHDLFNWPDGDNHWDNFLKYKEVFGDVDLDSKPKRVSSDASDVFGDCADLGFGIDCEEFEDEEEEEEEDDAAAEEAMAAGSDAEFGDARSKKSKKGCIGVGKKLGLVGSQVLGLRDMVMKREEGRRERDFERDKDDLEREEEGKDSDFLKEERRIDREQALVDRECELEHRQALWARRETEKRLRLEHEISGEKRRRMRMEEKREEEEMEWRERMLGLQIEHEKQMMQMHAEACQNQMQILGIMARFMCQFFGSASDGLSAGLGGLTPQVLQHPGGLGDNGKPDANSPSEFL